MDINKSSSDAITRAFLDSLLLEVRHLDSELADTGLELFGRHFDTPVMTGALSHLFNVREDGMAEMARGAKAANAVMWCGMGSMEELDGMTATGASVIKIVKPYADREDVARRIRHAYDCGCMAVGIDIDHAFSCGRRAYDEIEGMEMRPMTSAELADLVKESKLPFVIKGVLSRQDARKCADAGVSGIVVSHHNGRLGYSAPPLMVLPEIMAEVGGSMKVFVDCSLQSGIDVFKALALGATAVSVGRPLMESLRKGGAEAVAKHIGDITEELAYTMAMTCSPDIAHIDPSVVHPTTFSW